MSVQRSPYTDTNQELMRQAERIREQSARLENILGDINAYLGAMKDQHVESYNEALGKKIVSLQDAITSYIAKYKPAYKKMAEAIDTYASRSSTNMEELGDTISSVTQSIDSL